MIRSTLAPLFVSLALMPACMVDTESEPAPDSDEVVDDIDAPENETEAYWVPTFCSFQTTVVIGTGHNKVGSYTCNFRTYSCSNGGSGQCNDCIYNATGLEKSSNCPSF